MNGKILILPKIGFDRAMSEIGINDKNVETVYDSFAFISIGNSKLVSGNGKNAFTPAFEENHFFEQNHVNVLNIVFDDIGPELKESEPSLVLFSDEQAKEIIAFWRMNQGKKFVIHCTAGISRSGAVGSFIRQIEGYDYEDFIKDNPNIQPNSWVLNLLMKNYE